MITNIDFSAQFGGRDAAAKLLPHFKALKLASKSIDIEGFPYPEIAFILRVDGDVNQYGNSGVGNIDCTEDYVSLDIVITKTDQSDIPNFIKLALDKSIEALDSCVDDYSVVNLKPYFEKLFNNYKDVISI